MYVAAGYLRGLGVISNTKPLISYLFTGFVDGLKLRVSDDVNLYSSSSFLSIILGGVTAAVEQAASSSSNQLNADSLMSQIDIRLRDSFPGGNPNLEAFGNSAQRNEGIRHLNNLTVAVWSLSSELLAKWVPPTQATGSNDGAAVNVDTSRAQQTLDQNAAASGAVVSGESFLSKYGLYLAAGVVLLLLISKGK